MDRGLSDKLAILLDHLDEPANLAEIATLLEEHPELVERFVEQWRVHSLLEWSLCNNIFSGKSHGEVEQAPETVVVKIKPRLLASRVVLAFWVAAAMVFIATGLLFLQWSGPVGTIVAVRDIKWAQGTRPLKPGDPIHLGVLESISGGCTLRFNSGVEMACDDGFRLRVIDDMLVELDHGTLRAKVPQNAHGFAVDTPDMKLVDRGTEFGVRTEAGGSTKIVVFRGEVDVQAKNRSMGKLPRRLTQGEAAQYTFGEKYLDRVPEVVSQGSTTTWSTSNDETALFSIRDNIRAADSLKYYNIVVNGLHEDVPVWVDRAHEWNGIDPSGIPEIVRGADYARTFNDDRYNRSFKMFVTVHRPAILYVFIDNRIDVLPDWLLRDFEDTGEDIGLDEGWHAHYQTVESARGAGQSVDLSFSIWRRVMPRPATIELGSIQAPPDFGMYGLAAKPLEPLPAPSTESNQIE